MTKPKKQTTSIKPNPQKKEPAGKNITFDKKLWLPLLVTIASWFVIDYFSEDRARQNKIRDLKTSYLIESYRKLALAANRDTRLDYDIHFRNIESAVADINLFGSKKEIKILKNNFMNHPTDSTWQINFDPILKELRNNLREELNLEEIKINVDNIRFPEKPND